MLFRLSLMRFRKVSAVAKRCQTYKRQSKCRVSKLPIQRPITGLASHHISIRDRWCATSSSYETSLVGLEGEGSSLVFLRVVSASWDEGLNSLESSARFSANAKGFRRVDENATTCPPFRTAHSGYRHRAQHTWTWVLWMMVSRSREILGP
jgi:hypothetical protein